MDVEKGVVEILTELLLGIGYGGIGLEPVEQFLLMPCLGNLQERPVEGVQDVDVLAAACQIDGNVVRLEARGIVQPSVDLLQLLLAKCHLLPGIGQFRTCLSQFPGFAP